MISGIYPGYIPESKPLPALSAFIVSELLTDALDDSAALITQNIQINAVANTAQEADAIAREVVAALHKQSGDGISRASVTNRRDEPPIAFGSSSRNY